jgi:hypothetical protein
MIINKFMYQLHAYKVKLWGGYEKTFEGNVGLTPHEILSVRCLKNMYSTLQPLLLIV